MRSCGLGLCTFLLAGATRRSIFSDDSRRDAQQHSDTLTGALDLAAGGREIFNPAGFRSELFPRQGARAGAVQASYGRGLPRQLSNSQPESTLYARPDAWPSLSLHEDPPLKQFGSTTRQPIARTLRPKDRRRLHRRATVNLHAAHVQKGGGFDSTKQTAAASSEGELDGKASTEAAAASEDVKLFIQTLEQAEDYAEIVEMMREKHYMLRGSTFLNELESALSDARSDAYKPGDAGIDAAGRVGKLLEILFAEFEISERRPEEVWGVPKEP